MSTEPKNTVLEEKIAKLLPTLVIPTPVILSEAKNPSYTRPVFGCAQGAKMEFRNFLPRNPGLGYR